MAFVILTAALKLLQNPKSDEKILIRKFEEVEQVVAKIAKKAGVELDLEEGKNPSKETETETLIRKIGEVDQVFAKIAKKLGVELDLEEEEEKNEGAAGKGKNGDEKNGWKWQ